MRSLGTLLVMIGSGGVMALLGSPRIEGNLPPQWFGVKERIDAYGFILWMIVLAIVLLQTQEERLRGGSSNAGDHYPR